MLEIGNFKCVRCENQIPHNELKNTTVTLARDKKHVVLICEDCLRERQKNNIKTNWRDLIYNI